MIFIDLGIIFFEKPSHLDPNPPPFFGVTILHNINYLIYQLTHAMEFFCLAVYILDTVLKFFAVGRRRFLRNVWYDVKLVCMLVTQEMRNSPAK